MAQRRIGRDAGDQRVVTSGRQRGGQSTRIALLEVAAITQAADKRETPALRLDRKLRRSHHVPDCVRTLQIAVASITAIVRKPERSGCKGARIAHQFQPPLEFHAGGRIGQHLVDGAARTHEAPLTLRGLRQVGNAAPREGTAQQQRQQQPGGGGNAALG